MQISQKNEDLKAQNTQLQKLQNGLNNQKSKVDQVTKVLNDKISAYSNNLQIAKAKNLSRELCMNQSRDINNEFLNLKNDISTL